MKFFEQILLKFKKKINAGGNHKLIIYEKILSQLRNIKERKMKRMKRNK
jgi:hypothetical protein